MFLNALELKVVELGHWIAAPMATCLLAGWGAEVVKVEHPQRGDAMRGLLSLGILPAEERWQMNCWLEMANRRKRDLAVDIHHVEGRQVIYRLVERSDVLVTNLSPQALHRARMDYATLCRINPRLVYAGASGFGMRGKEGGREGYNETAFWARAGNMMALGEPDREAPTTLHPLTGEGDMQSAMHLVAGIGLALLARERTGKGQEVQISVMGTGVWNGACVIQPAALWGKEVIAQASREEPPNPLTNFYPTKDNKWLYILLLQWDQDWPRFCRAVGGEELLTDPRFESFTTALKNRRELTSIIETMLKTRTGEEWGRIFDEQGFVWAPIQSYDEVVTDPQVLANGYITEFEHPKHGPMKTVGCPIQLSGANFQFGRAPEMGEHTEAILWELGYNREKIDQLREKGVVS